MKPACEDMSFGVVSFPGLAVSGRVGKKKEKSDRLRGGASLKYVFFPGGKKIRERLLAE